MHFPFFMRFFYHHTPESGVFDKDESIHIARVLKLHPGDEIKILDGRGMVVNALLTEVSKKRCAYTITETNTFERTGVQVHLAVVPVKNRERVEWMTEKLTELGVAHISFLESHYGERSRVNFERLQSKSVTAVKQSKNPFLPQIDREICDLSSFIERDQSSVKLVADVSSCPNLLHTKISKNDKVTVVIGPEGGFTEKETTLLNNSGYQSVSLGDYILRNETAAMVAAALIKNMVS